MLSPLIAANQTGIALTKPVNHSPRGVVESAKICASLPEAGFGDTWAVGADARQNNHLSSRRNPVRMSANHVRRDKAALPVGARPTRRFALAGSNRGRHGGDEMSEAPG